MVPHHSSLLCLTLHLFLVSRFVSYDSAAAAESAIQGLNNVPVGGRRLKVQ
jgi:hypothetical protein